MKSRDLRYKVGLELVQINVEGAIETEGCSDRGDHLSDETVEIGEAWRGNVKTLLADVVDSLVVDHERAVGVLKRRVGRQDGVVGLDNGARKLGGGVYAELKLRLLAVVHRQPLQEERTETGTSAATKRVEDEEALETRAVVGQAAGLVHHGCKRAGLEDLDARSEPCAYCR